jgi:hypothetical protein
MCGSLALALGQVLLLAAYNQNVAEDGWAQAVVRAFYADHAYGAITALGVLLLIGGWALVRGEFQRGNPRWLSILLMWVAPLLPVLGVLSTDSALYAEFGYMQLAGLDPYSTGLGSVAGPFAHDGSWVGMTAAYPAFALRLMAACVWLGGCHWYWGIAAMRLLALAGLALLVWGLSDIAPRIGVDKRFALWLGAFNPIVIVHGVGGMHVDLLMAGLCAAGLALAYRHGGFIWGALVVGLAAGVKQQALLAAIPVAIVSARTALDWGRTVLRSAVGVLISAAVFVLGSFAVGLSHGWLKELDTPTRYDTPGTLTLSYRAVTAFFNFFAVPAPESLLPSLKTLSLVVSAGLLLFAYFRYARTRPYLFLAAGALVATFGLSGTREWYVTMFICLLPLANPGKAMCRAASLIVPFLALTAAFHSYQGWQVMEAMYVCAGVALAVNAAGWLVKPAKPANLAQSAPAAAGSDERMG